MAEVISKLVRQADVSQVMPFIGLILFGWWLLRTSFGRKALADSPCRRNIMSSYTPFLVLLVWAATTSIAARTAGALLPELPDEQAVFVDNLIYCLGGVGGIILIVFVARANFARRLKGFGLDIRTALKDFFVGTINLISIWPLVLLMIIITTFIGQKIWGVDFEVEQHKELETITAYSQLSIRIVILINAAVIVPIFEELLFRGLFQTMIRSVVIRPWVSIFLSSLIFTAVHINASHWPALLVLAFTLGYAYEKNGSLLRPIFIHTIFNATAIIAMMMQ